MFSTDQSDQKRGRISSRERDVFPSACLQASGLPSLVVFGGSGYLGSRICQEALKAGLPVTGVSRSGRPPNEDGAWCNEVTWHSANALYSESYSELLRNSLAVISTIGLISTSQEDMLRMNGEANKVLINAAADAGVGRFAYISAHDYQFPADLVVLKGYFQGKRDAEAALAARFPDSGASLNSLAYIVSTRRGSQCCAVGVDAGCTARFVVVLASNECCACKVQVPDCNLVVTQGTVLHAQDCTLHGCVLHDQVLTNVECEWSGTCVQVLRCAQASFMGRAGGAVQRFRYRRSAGLLSQC